MAHSGGNDAFCPKAEGKLAILGERDYNYREPGNRR